MDAATRSKGLLYDGGKTDCSRWRGRPHTFFDRVSAQTGCIGAGKCFERDIEPTTEKSTTRHSQSLLERRIVESELFCSERRRCAARESQGIRGKSTRLTQAMNDSYAAALYLPAVNDGVSRES